MTIGTAHKTSRLLDDWVLGPPGLQRDRAAHTLLVILIFGVFAAVQQFEVWAGLIDQVESTLLTGYNLSCSLMFYLVIRSGLNLRRKSDPALGFEQCLFGISSICGSYAITGPARGGIMAILLLVMVFSMFALKPPEIRKVSAIAVIGLVTVMVWKHQTLPLRYPAAVEVTHALIVMVLMSSISLLSVRIHRMHALLQHQKADLSDALAENSRLATLDELTGLTNRRCMNGMLRTEHERQRRGGRSMSVALIDIDFFKRINDAHGHAAGDEVLRRFARLAVETMRVSDTVCRWGGEEFLIAMPATNAVEAFEAVDRLRRLFAAQTVVEGDEGMRTTFSAGIALHTDTESVEELIECADRNMYAAKQAGRDRVVVDRRPTSPEPATEDSSVEPADPDRLDARQGPAMGPDQDGLGHSEQLLEQDLRRGLRNGELLLFYQPRIGTLEGRVTSVEALIRWRRDGKDWVSPCEFIPVAERSQLIVEIGDWVIDAACDQARRWRDAGVAHLIVAVNVSARQLRDSHLETSLLDAVQRHGILPSCIEIEVTESVLVADLPNTRELLTRIRAAGFGVALDDFGTGFSSLSYLRQLPFDSIKIDRSFVVDTDDDDMARAIAQSIVTLAKTLGKRVVAEGIESEKQGRWLTSIGCDELQGFYYGKPVPADQLAPLLPRSDAEAAGVLAEAFT